MNTVVHVGRIVTDIDLKTTTTGKNVAKFRYAVKKDIKPQDGQPDSFFFGCVVWGQQAEFVSNYGEKGREIAITGRLENRKYTASDGAEREAYEIVADRVQLIGGVKDNGGGSSASAGGNGGGRRRAPAPAPSPDEYDPFADE
jgi:single-strand DNA-binding protein